VETHNPHTLYMSARACQQLFCKPTAVYSKKIDDDATYEDVVRWWQSDDGVAQAGRAAVQQGAVCFVQLGGTQQVFVSVPPGRCAVQPCRKVRGAPGVAVLMTYV
jgi:hypothetical protein